MNTKGQLTIFIIIGIILIIAAGMMFYISYSEKIENDKEFIPLNIAPIQSFIGSCSSHVLMEGVRFLRYRGGYYNLPEDSTFFSLNGVPYYYHFNKGDISPSLEDIENELSAYIEDNFEYCLKGLVMFTEQGFNIKTGNLRAEVDLNPLDVIAYIHLPVEIAFGESVVKLESFKASENTDFYRYWTIAKNLTDEIELNPGFVPVTSLIDIGIEHDILFDISYSGDSIIFFERNKAGNSFFLFAARYNWSEIKDFQDFINDIDEKPVEIETIGEINVSPDEYIFYQVRARGSNLKYSVNNPIINIEDNTGLIKIEPDISQIGHYPILLTVLDDLGNEAYELFMLNIGLEYPGPVIDYIGDKYVSVGENISFFINASSPTSSPLFFFTEGLLDDHLDISSGLVNFTPQAGDERDYIIEIKVMDANLNFATTEFFLSIS
ncbi:MAG: hypothetical protein U9R34_06290 [Nanoarchaeota archaeon]|nr:hypothetical protein [Nanoarchaeota archaeon]